MMIFPDAHLFRVEVAPKDLEDISNFLEEGKAPEDLPTNKKKVLALKVAPFTIINGYLYKMGIDDVLRRCVPEHERDDIINEAHAGEVGGHFQADTTARKILQAGLWWSTLHKYCRDQVRKCDSCQRLGRPLWKNEMPLSSINPNRSIQNLGYRLRRAISTEGKKNWCQVHHYCGRICD
jgi:hypothetical protein